MSQAASRIDVLPWTPEQLETARGYVNAGASIPIACEAVGLRWSTVQHWLVKGNAGVEPYAEFVATMRRAQAMHRVGTRLVITAAAKRGDWRAAAYLEARRELAEERRRERQPPAKDPSDPVNERVVLLYPVPVPDGAEVSDLVLAPGHHPYTDQEDPHAD